MKKFILLLISLIILGLIFVVPAAAYNKDYNINDNPYSDFYILNGNFIIFNCGNLGQCTLTIPSDKVDFFAFNTEGNLVNISSSTITCHGWFSELYEFYTCRFTSFGTLEVRIPSLNNYGQSVYTYTVYGLSASDIIYTNIDLSSFSSEINKDFDIPKVFKFDSYQLSVVCCLIVLCFFNLFNWFMLHKKMR